MYLSSMNCRIYQADPGDALQFSPPPLPYCFKSRNEITYDGVANVDRGRLVMVASGKMLRKRRSNYG
jgi:hypothetical protein